MFNKVLVVCVGNICRSPVVEYLLKHDSRIGQAGVEVASAGLSALVGRPADPSSVEVLAARGIDLTPHVARQLTPQMIFASDLVLVMESWQQKEVERLVPAGRGKVHTVGRWQGFEIPDPYRKPKEAFEEMLALAEKGVADWRKKLWS